MKKRTIEANEQTKINNKQTKRLKQANVAYLVVLFIF